MMRLGIAFGLTGLPLAESARLARQAEARGFDTVCAGESGHDSFAAAALLASATGRARVMTAVTTWVRPPVTTAVAAATVAEVAAGRFALGLGTMPVAWNRDWYGVAPDHPVQRMREYVTCVRQVLASSPGVPVHHDGRFYRIRGYVREPVAPGVLPVPVHLAATQPRMARLAGEISDGVVVNVIHTLRWLRDVIAPAVEQGRKAAGREQVECGVMLRCIPHGPSGRERDMARRLARRSLERYQRIPYFARVVEEAGWSPDAITDEMADAMCAIGTTDQLNDRLASYDGLADWVELVPAREQPAAGLRRAYQMMFELGPRR